MGVPRDKDARKFYLAAGRRLEDSEILFDNDRTRGAMYLSGYCVECMLKALIITQAPKAKKPEVLDEFRGSGAHNFDRLRHMYHKHGGSRLPKLVIEAFVSLQEWGTHWRYEPTPVPADDAESFLKAVHTIHDWADRRL